MTVIEFYDLLKDKQETLRTEADLWKHASHEDEAKSTIARIVLMTFRTPLPPYPMLRRPKREWNNPSAKKYHPWNEILSQSHGSTLDRGEGGCERS